MAISYPTACSFAGSYVPASARNEIASRFQLVDGNNGHRQFHEFSFFKVFAGEAVHFVRDLVFVYLANRFGPAQRRPLARSEKWRFPPNAHGIEALLGFATCASIFGMHVHTIGTSVDDGS